MKAILRIFVFTAVAVRFSQYLLSTFDFGQPYLKNYLFIVLALTLLYVALTPVLAMINLPYKGLGGLIFNLILTFVILYVLTLFIPAFSFMATKTVNLLIFGFMLPSKSLTGFWSGVIGSSLVSLTYSFLGYLSSGKK